VRPRRSGAWQAWLVGTLQQRSVLFALVFSLFFMGALVGAVSVNTLDSSSMVELSAFVRDLLASLRREGAAVGEGWQWVLVDDVLKTAGLVWLLGLSVVGVPFIAAVVFLRGFVLGFALAFLVKDLVLRGVVLALVALLPQQLFLLPGLAFAAVAAIAFSIGALRIVLGRPGARDIFAHFRTEGVLALVGCALLFAGGMLKAYVVPALTAVAGRFLL
jgi:stage II sporulation protein M